METRKIKTKIKVTYTDENGRKLMRNDRDVARVDGVKLGLCDLPNDGKEYTTMTLKDNAKIMIAECTEEQYELFKKTIEKLYPGLCEFDVE
jgi:hypothetical protein